MEIQYVITCKIEYKITACSGGLVEIVVSRQSGGPGSTSAVNNFVFFFFSFGFFFICKYPFIGKTKQWKPKLFCPRLADSFLRVT